MAFNEPHLLKAGANHITTPATGFEKLMSRNPLMLLSGQFGRISRGGHLYVTTTHLVFEPHSLNDAVEQSRLRIPLVEITGMRTHQRMASAVLTVSTVRGVDIDFLCWSREKVMAAVEQARQRLQFPGHNQPT